MNVAFAKMWIENERMQTTYCNGRIRLFVEWISENAKENVFAHGLVSPIRNYFKNLIAITSGRLLWTRPSSACLRWTWWWLGFGQLLEAITECGHRDSRFGIGTITAQCRLWNGCRSTTINQFQSEQQSQHQSKHQLSYVRWAYECTQRR